MTALEKIVRPFQTGEVFNARRLAPALPHNATPPDDVLITVEGSAEAKYTEEPGPASLGYTVEWIEDKSRRVTETVRVENPDNSDQYVELERIKQMVLKNNKNGEEIPIKMDWRGQ